MLAQPFGPPIYLAAASLPTSGAPAPAREALGSPGSCGQTPSAAAQGAAAPQDAALALPAERVSLGAAPAGYSEDRIFADEAAFRQLLRDSRKAQPAGTLDNCNQVLDNCNQALESCNQVLDDCHSVFS
jgi:hypothetical protein